jgi:hypothetical protein
LRDIDRERIAAPAVSSEWRFSGPVAAAGAAVRHASRVSTSFRATGDSTQAGTHDYSRQKLDAAAAAVKQVSTVKGTFEQKLAQAPAAEKERLVDEANDAMKKAVTDQGLSIDEYATILQVAQNDPIVRDKLLQRLK